MDLACSGNIMKSLLLVICVYNVLVKCEPLPNNGCADGTVEGFPTHPRLAACGGSWHGHIRNSSNLCADGWHVCSWLDVDLLRTIAWSQALSVDGCYAYNAANDRGQCQECASNINQDDMAGVGKKCPHQNSGQNSCLASGRIDASCCIDSFMERACTYIPGVISGVMCCKPEETVPRIIVSTQAKVITTVSSKMMLECHATGKPKPEIKWYKDGKLISDISENVKLTPELGMLEILSVGKSDDGVYKCVAANIAGSDSQLMNVTVLRKRTVARNKGCLDSTVEGLQHLPGIAACEGVWHGHIRHGKVLCAPGWRVCSAKDNLKQISWEDATSIDGCFAYNAVSNYDQCTSCPVRDIHNVNSMAGVGKDCQYKHRKQSSCLVQGRIDVLKENESKRANCKYQPGVTTGVLCCKQYPAKRKKIKPACRTECQNGGSCGEDHKCHCPPGHKGAACQNAICDPKCGQYGTCIRPGACECQPGYGGNSCQFKVRQFCLNGGEFLQGKCVCPVSFKGKHCQHKITKQLLPWLLNDASLERNDATR